MKAEEADTLAKRIINTFRNTPPLTEWRDVLRALDYQRAVQTFERCRNTIADNLPIARYFAEYNANHVDYGWQRPEDTGPPISLDEYLRRHPEDVNLARFRHPTARSVGTL